MFVRHMRRWFATTSWPYLLLCVALSALSVVTLVSVGKYGDLAYGGTLGNMKPAVTQALAAGLGLLCAVVLSLIDVRHMLRLWPLHAAFCWFLVLLTFVPGIGYAPPGTGSQSWIALPLGMSIQPTELAKASFCVTFAAHLQGLGPRLSRPIPLLGLLAHLAGPVLVVHLQGDTGGAVVFLVMGTAMVFAAGLNRWVVVGGAALAGASLPLVWQYVLTGHQRSRVLGLLQPEAYADTIMHQQLRSLEAVQNGGVWGTGLFSQQHTYVPKSENDFIFSYFAESWGLVGSLVLVGLLFLLLFKTLGCAARAENPGGAVICVGVFAALMFQTTINIGMNLMLVPVMGVTLPFLSAGGTSMLSFFILAGIVMSVGRGNTVQKRPRHRIIERKPPNFVVK